MNTEDAKNIESIEALTLHSLDRTLEGLEMLRRDSIRGGEALLTGGNEAKVPLGTLLKNLKDFYVFENDVCSLFMVDREKIRDARGTLASLESRMEKAMGDIMGRLETGEMDALADILRIDVPMVLDRFQDLLPALRNHIENEYVLTAV